MSIRIAPSILSADFSRLGDEVRALEAAGADLVRRTLGLIRESGCKAGLVFNPATSLDHLRHVMDKIDIVLLMSVNPGFGGQKFIPSTAAASD